MTRKRILFVVTDIGVGGAELMLQRLAERLDRRRFDPAVVAISPEEDSITAHFEALDIPVIHLGMDNLRQVPIAVARLAALIRTMAPDLIQGWMYRGNFFASLAAILAGSGAPVFWSVHHCIYDLRDEGLPTRTLLRMSRLLSRRTTAIGYVSALAAQQHRAIGFAAEKGVVMPNGFDCERFRPDPRARAELRQELGIGLDQPVIGLMSRYVPLKDHETFFRAATIVARQLPDLHFVLGGHDITAENRPLMRQIETAGIGARTHLLGLRRDTQRVLAALDIASNTSVTEAFPLIVGEAMACGLSCVATDVGDTRLLVGSAGRLVRARDPGALAGAWLTLISLGAEGRRELGERARQRIVANFSLAQVVERYEALYEARGGYPPGTPEVA